jgi:hypothetical protein
MKTNAQSIRVCLGLSRFIPRPRFPLGRVDDFENKVTNEVVRTLGFHFLIANYHQSLYHRPLLMLVKGYDFL